MYISFYISLAPYHGKIIAIKQDLGHSPQYTGEVSREEPKAHK